MRTRMTIKRTENECVNIVNGNRSVKCGIGTSRGGAVKFGISVEGWNWHAAPPSASGNSYLSLAFQFGVWNPKELKISSISNEDYALISTFEDKEVRLNLDWGYVLDGNPAIVGYRFEDAPIGLEEGWTGFDTAVSFCQPMPHDVGIQNAPLTNLSSWNSVYYDPSLQVIFGAMSNVNNGPGAKRASWITPVSIAVPLGVVLIVAVIIILFVFVRPQRSKVLPSTRSVSDEVHSSPSSVQIPSSDHNPAWLKADKPAQS